MQFSAIPKITPYVDGEFTPTQVAQSAGAVVYTNRTSAEG